jgi:hypothetical protein
VSESSVTDSNAISCAGHVCVAVGYLTGYLFTGSNWESINPSGNGQRTILTAVSCASGRMCMAIGYAFNQGCSNCNQCANNCAEYSYAERWNGTSFVTTDSAVGTGLGGSVSCPSTRLCIAVDGTGAPEWTGHTWHASQLAAPAGLNSISCASPSSCLVVGTLTLKGSPPALSNIAAHWNGKKWSLDHPIGPAGLADASCARPDRCLVVGQADGQTLAESWNGTAWKLLNPINL